MPSSPSISHTHLQHPSSHELDDQNNKKWQEEISTGFDRLVAYATEVDKRRKSCDSNSPSFPNDSPSANTSTHGDSPINATTPELNRPSSAMLSQTRGSSEEIDQFDNRMSTLSMKFKRAPNYQRYPGPPLRSPTSSSLSSGSRHFAASSIPRDHDLISSSSLASIESNSVTRASLIASSRAQLPGENLPEHHFKKRYFAETMEDTGRRNDTVPQDGAMSLSLMNPKKRLSMLGTNSPTPESPSSTSPQCSRAGQGGLERIPSMRVSRDEGKKGSRNKTVNIVDVNMRRLDKKDSTNSSSPANNTKGTSTSASSSIERCSPFNDKTKT